MKAIAAVLALCGIVLLSTTTANASYQDVMPDAWYSDAIDFCAEANLLKGRASNRFEPNQPVTLAELAVALDRFSNYIDSGNATTWIYNPAYLDFDETSSNGWYIHSAHTLTLWGFPPERYAPDGYQQPATRRALIQLLSIILPSDSFKQESSAAKCIPDVATSASYYEYLLHLYSAGIICGKDDGKFCPEDSLTRAELAVIFSRIVQQVC